MNAFIAILALCAAAVSGDVTVNVDTVMCNCAAPNNENYVRMHEAHVECGAYPEGAAGHASCITNTLGFVSILKKSRNLYIIAFLRQNLEIETLIFLVER